MPGTGVAGNQWLIDRITQAQTALNTGHSLRLFQNNFTPVPGSLLSAFTEANFAGYTARVLTGTFGAPAQIQNGEYQISTGTFTWTYASGPDQTIYGWYVTDASNWKLAQVLPSPFVVTVGSTLSLILRVQDWSLSIVP